MAPTGQVGSSALDLFGPLGQARVLPRPQETRSAIERVSRPSRDESTARQHVMPVQVVQVGYHYSGATLLGAYAMRRLHVEIGGLCCSTDGAGS